MNRTIILASFIAISLAACTTTAGVSSPTPSTTNTPSATASASPSSTPTTPPGCYYQEVQCVQAPCDPVLVCQSASPTSKSNTATPKASATAKSEVKSQTTVNSNTNISVNSNNVKVEITNKNGEKWAQVTIDGKVQEVKLDANGCYDYNNGGNKIHVCT